MKLDQLVELTNDRDLAIQIIEVSRLVNKFCYFSNAVDIGIRYTPQDMSFTDMMLFSWIKDGLSHGRKT